MLWKCSGILRSQMLSSCAWMVVCVLVTPASLARSSARQAHSDRLGEDCCEIETGGRDPIPDPLPNPASLLTHKLNILKRYM